eukprot:TRINITY_DN16728_c0_g1_i1.p1 TRINITY_DN16728_c0_g1~~TRINITY_DN16728_c0_g1_i1.p1  ORF type:complete len:399 (-),score=117.22 TRINITY_DN16728_c0_g1_i1:100-1296(-)
MASENEQVFGELLGLLQDAKPEVQRFAAEGVLESTESLEFVEYVKRYPRQAARPLLRLSEKAEAGAAATHAVKASEASTSSGSTSDKQAQKKSEQDVGNTMAAGEAALKALVNLSSVPPVQAELVDMNAPKRITEAFRAGWLEGRVDMAHWHSMLLANITTGKVGQEAICKEEGMFRFLHSAYIAKPRPPPRDGYDDPLSCLGKVLGNLCVLPDGRKILAGGEQGPGTVSSLTAELSDRSRRLDMMNLIKNLCLDEECHKAIVATDLVPRMATFLYPSDKVDAESRSKLPEALQKLLEEEKAFLTGEASVRMAAASTFMALIRTLEGREYLRAMGSGELLRAWSSEETLELIKASLETAIPGCTLSEEELKEQCEKAEAEASKAAAQDAPLGNLDGFD